MNKFQFGQNPKEKSCGWRCLHYLIPETVSYEGFLERFRYVEPIENGITFTTILHVLKYYEMKCTFTVPRSNGTYLIWARSKVWKYAGGHYFIYQNGVVLDTVSQRPMKWSLEKVIASIESDSVKDSFVCVRLDK